MEIALEPATLPDGTTHTATFYGTTFFYKRVERRHLNQVSEEWQTLVDMYYWDLSAWSPVGSGFCGRHLVAANQPLRPAETTGDLRGELLTEDLLLCARPDTGDPLGQHLFYRGERIY